MSGWRAPSRLETLGPASRPETDPFRLLELLNGQFLTRGSRPHLARRMRDNG